MLPPALIRLATLLIFPLPGLAHEFWIEPEDYQVETGEEVVAHLKNGENFSGIDLAFFDHQTDRFDLFKGDKVQPYRGRMGDIPALLADPGSDGLLIVVHQTTPATLKYSKWEDFQRFVDHKGFADIRNRHQNRNLPESGFQERYTRFAKALIGVGPADGQDRATAMETEFVALANPYRDDLSQGLPIRLLYRGEPRPDAQIEVFARAPDGSVTVTTTRTDPAGHATIPVLPGHDYLLDAVVLREASDGPAVWETLWASMTFHVP